MLVDAERRRDALLADSAPSADGTSERLRRVLERLPEIVQQRLRDLQTLLAAEQIDRGKQILAALDTRITLHPVGTGLEVEITGRIEALVALAMSSARGSNGAQQALPKPP